MPHLKRARGSNQNRRTQQRRVDGRDPHGARPAPVPTLATCSEKSASRLDVVVGRHRAKCGGAIVLALTLLASLSARADTVDVVVSSQAPSSCLSAQAVGAAIVAQLPGARIVTKARVDALVVSLFSTDQGRLRLRVEKGERGIDRAFPFEPGDCAAAADSIALIAITFWQSRVQYRAEPDEPASKPVHRAPPRATPPDARPPPPDARPPLVPPPAPPLLPVAKPERFLQPSIAVVLGGAIGLDRKVPAAFTGAAMVDLGLGAHFGVGVRAAAGTPFKVSDDRGLVEALRVPVMVYGRYSPFGRKALGLSAYLGVALDITRASINFSERGTLLDGAAWLALSGQWRFHRGLYAQVGFGAEISFRAQDLSVPGALPRAWLDLWTGLGYTFF